MTRARRAVAALAGLAAAGAHARAIDEVRFSRVGDEATIEIELGCDMRYDSHAPLDGGDLRIQVTLGYDCRLALRTDKSDVRHPAGSRMADLLEIAFDADERGRGVITLRFASPVRYEITQTSNRYLLTVSVRPGTPAQQQEAPPLPLPEPVADIAQSPAPPRAPLRQVRTLPGASPDRFVVRVAELDDRTDVDDRALTAALADFPSGVFYAFEIPLGARAIRELRMGFFESEAEAGRALAAIGSSFGSSWIAVADPDEQARALAQRIEPREDAAKALVAAPPDAAAGGALPGERVEPLMADAKGALLRRDYGRSIELYSRLAATPGAHRPEARELLGVAFEKDGRPDRARSEYEAWLGEFGGAADPADANRVTQRLASLEAPAPPAAREPPPAVAAADESSAWELYGSASQYYLRGVSLARDDGHEDVVGQSALLSQAVLFARRTGERFDVASRANVGYLHDFAGEDAESQALVSYAYVDVADTKTDVSARIGRQRHRDGGTLGRFDGLLASYRWRPDLSVSVSAGFPVDSPRYRPTGDQWFWGAGVDFDDLLGLVDVGVFTNLQTIEGIPDRRAVGFDAQYHGRNVNLFGLVDYDASFRILNTGLVTGNWRLNDRLTLHGRYRGGAAPFLTTRNAIIGQPVGTLGELFPDYTEGQLRRLARNRTAEERAGAAGVSAALTPRLQLELDTAWSELSVTAASGGVAAFPETGPRWSWGGHLLGSGFFRPGHLFLLGYRHDETRQIDGDTVFVDLRQPVGERLRIQSRLDVGRKVADQNPEGDIEQWVASPMLRVAWDLQRRYRIELELGGQWSNRKFPEGLVPPLVEDDAIEQADYYLTLGYTLDF